jgi:putative intracellular protease/amidase
VLHSFIEEKNWFMKIAFIVPPFVEILDLAGPVQVFTEARYYGFEAELEFYCLEEASVSSSGLPFGKVSHFSEANLCDRDYLFVPGMDFQCSIKPSGWKKMTSR